MLRTPSCGIQSAVANILSLFGCLWCLQRQCTMPCVAMTNLGRSRTKVRKYEDSYRTCAATCVAALLYLAHESTRIFSLPGTDFEQCLP